MYLKIINESDEMRDKLKDIGHYKVSARYLSNLKNKESSSSATSSSKNISDDTSSSKSKNNSPSENEKALGAFLQGLTQDAPQMVMDYIAKKEPSWFEKLTKR